MSQLFSGKDNLHQSVHHLDCKIENSFEPYPDIVTQVFVSNQCYQIFRICLYVQSLKYV